jgi:hypothetical protein
MQLGFSSNVTLDTVTLTNFIKNFNFCGRLYFNSLVAKPLSDLYCDSSSNFQRMTDKKSRIILIYWIKDTVIYTDQNGIN